MPFLTRPTITETYLERVKATPNLVGFQFKPTNEVIGPIGVWKDLTFKSFDEECRLVSFGLMDMKLEPKEKVAIVSNTRYEWALCDMAILGASAITVPIYASNTADDIVYILNHCEAVVAFLENSKQLEKILDRQGDLPHLKKIILLDPAAMNIAIGRKDIITIQALKEIGRRLQLKSPDRFDKNMLAARPGDILTICYTSGTTGTPKGAMITHENMMSVLEDCVRVFGKVIRPDREVLVAFLPFSHIIGKVESMATYVFGWKECYAENIDKLQVTMTEVKPTILFSVPRIFEKAYSKIQAGVDSAPRAQRELFNWAINSGKSYYASVWAGKRPSIVATAQYGIAKKIILGKVLDRFGGRLRFAICGGAPLSRETGEYFQIVGIKILEGYGLTETCAPVALNTVDELKFGTVGRPLPEVSIRIAEDGEILVKSKKVFSGYFKLPKETSEVFTDDWFHTGDIGHIDSGGFLHITDRKKDLIITSGGKNIAPQKLENLAKEFPLIHQIVVHGDRRNYLTAVLTLDHEKIVNYANEHQILFSEYAELVKNPKIKNLVQKSVDHLNSRLAGFETIKKFTILPQDFSVDTGELTPSMKIKRGYVNRKFKAEFDQMYTS